MEELVFYLICIVIVYLLYACLIIFNKKKLERYQESTEVRYLRNVYKLDIDKINKKALAHIMAFSNAFIISTVVMITNVSDNYLLKLLVGFVSLIPMIISVYHIVGKVLVVKYGKSS